ncbi:hypothetical protein [Methanobrevibacter sp. AbM4]|uniref:hypothetical protein n=1 Tax=Methanobrevibacter sp. AbM4 TaxID=224719 RepID=UPI0003348F71|nr:hypothetical protein [Methanobrevibacter sp. AbM4]AGN16025.1 hypothetical protein Abm4_0102 [Methanobrevibacter sp. AbM4]
MENDELIIGKEATFDLMEDVKFANIDVRKTIERVLNSTTALDMMVDVSCVTFLDDDNCDIGSLIHESREIDDDYFSKINEYINKFGVFITLAFSDYEDFSKEGAIICVEENRDIEKEIQDCIDRNEDPDYLEEDYNLTSYSTDICIRDFENQVPSFGVVMGIKIEKIGDRYVNEFGAYYEGGHFGPGGFVPYDMFEDINSTPLQIAIKLMYDTLVFKDN